MTRLTQIWPRLRQLILMLSSSHDGEVVNAARAIGRTLRDSGHDWHDLVADLSGSSSARPRPKEEYRERDTSIDWHEMHECCSQNLQRLRPREMEFMISLKEWHGDLTEKQYDWLASIYARFKRAA